MTKVTELIGSALNKNCLPIGFGPITFRIALVLETTATKTAKDRPGSETIHNYNSGNVASQMIKWANQYQS